MKLFESATGKNALDGDLSVDLKKVKLLSNHSVLELRSNVRLICMRRCEEIENVFKL